MAHSYLIEGLFDILIGQIIVTVLVKNLEQLIQTFVTILHPFHKELIKYHFHALTFTIILRLRFHELILDHGYIFNLDLTLILLPQVFSPQLCKFLFFLDPKCPYSSCLLFLLLSSILGLLNDFFAFQFQLMNLGLFLKSEFFDVHPCFCLLLK